MTDDLTPAIVSSVALSLTPETLETFVESLPAELVPQYLAALIDCATNLAALRKGLETRLILDGQTGQKWAINGTDYGFWGAKQSGFRREAIPSLLVNLGSLGITLSGIAECVSDLLVTNLRPLAEGLRDPEKRSLALQLIADARHESSDRGTPRFQPVTEYTKK